MQQNIKKNCEVNLESNTKLEDSIQDAGKKLGISGITLVFNEDGTNIDSDKKLLYYGDKKEIFILLALGEVWSDPKIEIVASENYLFTTPGDLILPADSVFDSHKPKILNQQKNLTMKSNQV